MPTLRIFHEVQPGALLAIYPGQQKPQSAYIELDCRTGSLQADWNGEVGNAVPADVWHGHTRRYAIPLLRGATVNALLDEIAPFAQRVLDGYASAWDGNNHVATFDDDASVAEEEIETIIESYGEGDLHWADAEDWLHEVRDELALAFDDETIDEMIDKYGGDGTEDAPVLVGIRDYLDDLRKGRRAQIVAIATGDYEPDVIANDDNCISYSVARRLWEGGEFSDWVEAHGGLPLTIDGVVFHTWTRVGEALSEDRWDNE